MLNHLTRGSSGVIGDVATPHPLFVSGPDTRNSTWHGMGSDIYNSVKVEQQ